MSNVANITFGDLTCSAYATLSGTALHKTLGELTLSSTGVAEISALLSSALGALTLSSTGAVQVSGTLVVTLGTLKGSQYDTSLTGAYAPYQQIATWDTHPASGISVKTRLGNLKGVFGVDGEYGLYAGEGWDEGSGAAPLSTSKYLRASNIAIEGHNLPIRLYDAGSATIALDPTVPSFAMGSTLPTAFDTGTGLWMGKDTDDEYKLRIGDPSGTRLEWDGDSLNVYNASINISGASAGLAFGDPPPTSASSGTGIWIDYSGFYSIEGGEYQVKIDTGDGKLYAANGNVVIDEYGISVKEAGDAVSFYSAGSLIGQLLSSEDVDSNAITLYGINLSSAGNLISEAYQEDSLTCFYYSLSNFLPSQYEYTVTSGVLPGNKYSFSIELSFTDPSVYSQAYFLYCRVYYYDSDDNILNEYGEYDYDIVILWNGPAYTYDVWRSVENRTFTVMPGASYFTINLAGYTPVPGRYATCNVRNMTLTLVESDSYISLSDGDATYHAYGDHFFEGNVNIEDNLAVDGYATVADYLTASGGIHVGGTSDPGTDNLVVDGTIKDANGNLYGRPVFLTTALTSTSWDGDSFSTTAKTLIDLSAVYGVPAGIKAILVALTIRDSGSGSNDCVFLLSTNDDDNYQGMALGASSPNDRYTRASIIMPCTADGDIYYRINASGTKTMDVFMSIWGYWL